MANAEKFFYDGQGSIRLDKFLASRLSDYSRTYIKERISSGDIKLNGALASKASTPLKHGDNIEITFPPAKEYELTPQKVDYELVYTHPEFLIINKPEGLLVHHASTNGEEKTLTAGLVYSFKEFNEFGDDERPGIVHRLDRDTSGLMVIARNIRSRTKISKLFKDRQVKKTYLAIVNGHPPREGKIEYSIGRHPVLRHKMYHMSRDGKPALSHYKVLAYYEDCSLVEVKIVTGRTHQIRVHFAAIGHGLIGDSVYGHPSKLIKRQALHSWSIAFEYGDKEFNFKRAVPEDMKKLLKHLATTRL